MKRLLIALAAVVAMGASASAADLGARPVYKAPPPAMVAAYKWSGFYIGGHVGWGSQETDATLLAAPLLAFPLGSVFSTSADGVLAGGQLGVNWQTGNWVFGLEGDVSWTNASGSVSTASVLIPGVVLNGNIDFNWFATATARVGHAWNNWLFYVKGGAAFTDFDIGGSATLGGPLATLTTFSDTRTGWTVGAGIEHGFAPNWSWKLEYNYMDFGSETYNVTTTPAVFGPISYSHDLDVHAVKFGVNYRFGPL